MKKTLLASVLLAGISAYAAIPSDINERADLVQKRNEIITKNINTLYQQQLQHSPLIDKFDAQIRDYTRNDSGATEKTVLTIDWNNAFFNDVPPPSEIVFNNTFDYSDAVAQSGKLAVITSKIDSEALAKQLELAKDSEEYNAVNEIVQHLEMSGVLLDDDKLEQTIRIKPVDATGNGVHVTYEGLEYTIRSSDDDIKVGAGKVQIKSGKLEINNSKAENDEPKIIAFLPFEGEGEFTKDGDLDFSTTPFELHIDETIAKVKKTEAEGKDLAFDPILGGFLGKAQYRIHDLAIATPEMPEAVYVKTIAFDIENKKSGELYNRSGSVEIIPVSESFSTLTGGMSEALGVESIVLKGNLSNISEKAMSHVNAIQADIQGVVNASASADAEKQKAAQDTLKQSIDGILGEAAANQSVFKSNFAVNTQNGNLTVDALLEFLKGGELTAAGVEAALQAENPQQFIELLGKSVRFEISAKLPKALADATGMTPMLEGMAGQFLKLDGDNYTLVLKNDEKNITLNGEVFPPAQ